MVLEGAVHGNRGGRVTGRGGHGRASVVDDTSMVV